MASSRSSNSAAAAQSDNRYSADSFAAEQVATRPFMKWPGGKESELPFLQKFYPTHIARFVEPFLGGGAAYFQATAESFIVNDRSEDLMALYGYIKAQDPAFLATLTEVSNLWDSVEVHRQPDVADLRTIESIPGSASNFIFRDSAKALVALGLPLLADKAAYAQSVVTGLKRKTKIAANSIDPQGATIALETAAKAALYLLVRKTYNEKRLLGVFDASRAVCFFFLREFCYSSMFRFSRSNEFNVPFGGHSYCKKSLVPKLAQIQAPALRARVAATDMHCDDFEKVLAEACLTESDFIFLDPPYDSAFSTYDNNEFGESDQERLARVLKETAAKFMLVVKNTPLMEKLYSDDRFRLLTYDMKYSVSFKNRNDKDVEHLMVLNYDPSPELLGALAR